MSEIKSEQALSEKQKRNVVFFIFGITIMQIIVYIFSYFKMKDIWYQLYFLKVWNFVKNNFMLFICLGICEAVLKKVKTKFRLTFDLKSERIQKAYNAIMKFCEVMIAIVVIKAVYDVVIAGGHGFVLHTIFAKAENYLFWMILMEILEAIYECLFGIQKESHGREDDKKVNKDSNRIL